jgi:hypothetical protein
MTVCCTVLSSIYTPLRSTTLRHCTTYWNQRHDWRVLLTLCLFACTHSTCIDKRRWSYNINDGASTPLHSINVETIHYCSIDDTLFKGPGYSERLNTSLHRVAASTTAALYHSRKRMGEGRRRGQTAAEGADSSGSRQETRWERERRGVRGTKV